MLNNCRNQGFLNYIRDGRAPVPKHELTSRIMRANKAFDTRPELLLRKALRGAGIMNYRLHKKGLAGCPDIVFSNQKLAVFVNGCFWHRCPYCQSSLPKSHRTFWMKKFQKNKIRDQEKTSSLHEIGWKVFVVWECQVKKNVERVVSKLTKAIHPYPILS